MACWAKFAQPCFCSVRHNNQHREYCTSLWHWLKYAQQEGAGEGKATLRGTGEDKAAAQKAKRNLYRCIYPVALLRGIWLIPAWYSYFALLSNSGYTSPPTIGSSLKEIRWEEKNLIFFCSFSWLNPSWIGCCTFPKIFTWCSALLCFIGLRGLTYRCSKGCEGHFNWSDTWWDAIGLEGLPNNEHHTLKYWLFFFPYKV